MDPGEDSLSEQETIPSEEDHLPVNLASSQPKDGGVSGSQEFDIVLHIMQFFLALIPGLISHCRPSLFPFLPACLAPFYQVFDGNQRYLPSLTLSLFLPSLFDLPASEAVSPTLTICLSRITSLPVREDLSASVPVSFNNSAALTVSTLPLCGAAVAPRTFVQTVQAQAPLQTLSNGHQRLPFVLQLGSYTTHYNASLSFKSNRPTYTVCATPKLFSSQVFFFNKI